MVRSGYFFGFSEHSDPVHCAAETIAQIQDDLKDATPNLVLLFVCGSHINSFKEIADSVMNLLSPNQFLGMPTGSIVANRRHIETGQAVSAWATTKEAEIYPITSPKQSTHQLPQDGTFLLFVGELAIGEFLASANENRDLSIVGGLLSVPGKFIVQQKSTIAQEVDGAVGIHFPNNTEYIVAHGCKPIGQPYVITSMNGNEIEELGGQTPFHRLKQTFSSLPPSQQAHFNQGLFLGKAVKVDKEELSVGDFLIQPIINIDQEGPIQVGGSLEIGDLVQFQLLSPEIAQANLQTLLDEKLHPKIQSALLFTCNGRSSRLYRKEDVESELIYEMLSDNGSLMGMSCAGEFGPIDQESFLHGFTATLLLFN